MRLIAWLVATIFLLALANCISIHGSTDAEAMRIARQIWSERFGKCGDSYFGKYDTGGDKLIEIYQYKDVEIAVDPGKIVEADKLNGVEWKGTTYLKPKAHRWWDSSSKEWTPWKNGVPLMGASFGLAQRFGKIHGQWTYEHYSFYKSVECSDLPLNSVTLLHRAGDDKAIVSGAPAPPWFSLLRGTGISCKDPQSDEHSAGRRTYLPGQQAFISIPLPGCLDNTCGMRT